jgi:hypothetical protein
MTTNALQSGIRELEQERTDILAQRALVNADAGRIRRQRNAAPCACGAKPKDLPHGSWCPWATLDQEAAANEQALATMDARLATLKTEIHRLRETLDIDFTKALRTLLKERMPADEFTALIQDTNTRMDAMRTERLTKP